VSREQNNAKRAGRAVLELAALLSDGNWYRTGYLGIAAGKYLRPEIAWRTGHGNISQGQRRYVNNKLDVWQRAGRVEKRKNGKFVEWRLATSDWLFPYLRALIEILREQAKQGHGQPVEKNPTLSGRIEREREIVRLHREGLSTRRTAELLGCHHSTVSRVLKAFEVQAGNVAAAPLSLRHRAAIADAPRDRQAEIVKSVIERRLTVEKTRQLVRLVRGEHAD